MFDDLKLFAAAKRGAGDFLAEWLSQGGSNNHNDIKSGFDFFSNPDALKKGKYATSGGYKGSGYSGDRTGTYGSLGSGNFLKDIVDKQMKPKPGDQGEFDTLGRSASIFFSEQGKLRTGTDMLKQMGSLLKDEVLIYLDQQSKLLMKINEETGLTGKLSEAFREEIMKASPEVIRLGISFEELMESVSGLVAQSGKFRLLSEDTIKEMALASKFTSDMKELAAMGYNFEKAGMGAKDMALTVEKMGLKSMTLGLNARATTTLINENLKNLNLYGFKNGIEGLNRMTQKSLEFRMNMSEVFKVAEKVWNPEDALSMVANLQVIGGAFGDLNDPIKLMYMATNNVEGLQDAISGAAKSLVTYNEEQGRFQVTGANLRRARAMAEELGVSLDELTNSAVASMERTSAASDLMGRGLTMKEEDKEFLTNLSQMKGGRMVIEVPKSLQEQLGNQTEIALESMTQEQTNLLLAQKQAFEKMSMEDVARQQVTAVENIERDVSFLRASARVSLGMQIGELLEKVTGLDQKLISGESKKVTDFLGKQISRGDELVAGLVKQVPELNLYGKAKGLITGEAKNQPVEEKKKEPEKSTTAEEKVSKLIIKHEVSSKDVSMDVIARDLFNRPESWMVKNPNDYLSNSTPSKN